MISRTQTPSIAPFVTPAERIAIDSKAKRKAELEAELFKINVEFGAMHAMRFFEPIDPMRMAFLANGILLITNELKSL